MPKKSATAADGAPASQNGAGRFSSFQTDPRYRLPSARKTKTTIDKRFSRMLKDKDFTSAAKIDRYGRKLKSDSKQKLLQRLYEEKDDGDDDDDDDEEGEGKDDDDDEVDDDSDVRRELKAANRKFDPARHGGFSESESDSDSEDEDEDEEEEEGHVDAPIEESMQKLQDEQAHVEAGEVTNRIAIVNLDWDHIRAADLYALFSSFAPSSGKVKKVTIYPSEFGNSRMQREELEGPPREIFSQTMDDEDAFEDDDSDDEEADRKAKESLIQEGDDREFDHVALRSYQLDRLRYYYAVMVCSDKETAKHIYDGTDGREYQASSNLIDLRFIPDDVTFDDDPHDECSEKPKDYKALDFVTDALQHSKVKLTWDMTPDEMQRKDAIQRKFKGGKEELEADDLRAYLASDSDEDAVEPDEDEDTAGPKLSKKELARRKMREALGLPLEGPSAKISADGPVGDMQITFSAALTDSKPEDKVQEETTIEKYRRKERERKDKKRQRAEARRDGRDPDAEPASDENSAAAAEPEDLGFDDPFFTAEEPKISKSAIREERRRKKREAREAREGADAEEKQRLELIMAADEADDQAEHLEHFDMNEILKAEKDKRKSSKRKKKQKDRTETRAGLQEDFQMDVDDRFTAVFESHEFAIDPSNPKFKATEGMKKLLDEGRKKRKADGADASISRGGREKKARKGDAELIGLVKAVKSRSAKVK